MQALLCPKLSDRLRGVMAWHFSISLKEKCQYRIKWYTHFLKQKKVYVSAAWQADLLYVIQILSKWVRDIHRNAVCHCDRSSFCSPYWDISVKSNEKLYVSHPHHFLCCVCLQLLCKWVTGACCKSMSRDLSKSCKNVCVQEKTLRQDVWGQ